MVEIWNKVGVTSMGKRGNFFPIGALLVEFGGQTFFWEWGEKLLYPKGRKFRLNSLLEGGKLKKGRFPPNF